MRHGESDAWVVEREQGRLRHTMSGTIIPLRFSEYGYWTTVDLRVLVSDIPGSCVFGSDVRRAFRRFGWEVEIKGFMIDDSSIMIIFEKVGDA